MTFAFKQRLNVQQQVRDIAIEQIDAGLQACQSDADFDKTVHGLRRRCKKIRGLLRLIEPRFEHFEAENRAVRAAAASLAGTRDAAVMIETFSALLEFDRDGKREPTIAMDLADAVRAMLEGKAAGRPDGLDRRQLLAAFADTMEQVGARARTWQIERGGFAGLGSGLELTYRRMIDSIEKAVAADSAAALHDWRKHTKYHWHHLSLFSCTAPDVLAGNRDLLDQLAELLGDHHNLHVLQYQLAAQPEQLDEAEVATLAAVIAEQQSVLTARAFDLGRQLTAERPGALRRRFEHYWRLLPKRAE